MEIQLTGWTVEQSAMTPANDRKPGELHAALLAVAFVIVTGMLLLVGLLRLDDSLGPQIGDIVSFPPSQLQSVSTASMTVSPATPYAHATCVLDVPVMQRFGGSLVIEATHSKPDRQFQAHWAGSRTSDGQEDCGGSADLVLNPVQIAALIFAAGGTGVKPVRE
jgi:hypothetical protein